VRRSLLFQTVLKRILHPGHSIDDLLNNYHYLAMTLIGSILFEIWAVISASNAVLHEADQKISKNNFSNFYIRLSL
jgi:hypothetical protein